MNTPIPDRIDTVVLRDGNALSLALVAALDGPEAEWRERRPVRASQPRVWLRSVSGLGTDRTLRAAHDRIDELALGASELRMMIETGGIEPRPGRECHHLDHHDARIEE